MELEAYTQYHETKLHEQPGFAYNTYLCTIPDDFSSVNLHWHAQMEIIYIKKGEGTVSVNLRSFPVHAGDIVPVLPGELHQIEQRNGQRMEYENIIFSLELLDSTCEDDWCRANVLQKLLQGTLSFPRPIVPGTPFHAQVSRCLDAADDACSHRNPGYNLLVKSQLFLFLYALFQNQTASSRESLPPNDHTEKLKNVIRFVREHYGENISIADAAAISGYSEAHFMRIFKQESGQTFIHFLTEYRLTAATYLLRETNESVSNIAARCGFDNFSYFTRIFKRKYGRTPSKLR